MRVEARILLSREDEGPDFMDELCPSGRRAWAGDVTVRGTVTSGKEDRWDVAVTEVEPDLANRWVSEPGDLTPTERAWAEDALIAAYEKVEMVPGSCMSTALAELETATRALEGLGTLPGEARYLRGVVNRAIKLLQEGLQAHRQIRGAT